MDNIFYSESQGSFHTRMPSKGNEVKGYVLIAENIEIRLASAFCAWSSRKQDLSNQFDKPFEYVGKKPKISAIKQDWIDFLYAYDVIHDYKATRAEIEARKKKGGAK